MWLLLPVRGLTEEQEKQVAQAVFLEWLLYGQVHLTNANGFTMLDPRGVTYNPTARDPQHWKHPVTTPVTTLPDQPEPSDP